MSSSNRESHTIMAHLYRFSPLQLRNSTYIILIMINLEEAIDGQSFDQNLESAS